MTKVKTTIFLLVGTIFIGCTTQNTQANTDLISSSNLTSHTTATQKICTEPRRKFCTREYNPVCANIQTKQGMIFKTFSTGCTACANKSVKSYTMGKCSE